MINSTTQALICSAANVTFSAKSDSITILMDSKGDSTSYVVIEIDGEYYNRFKVYSDSLNRISFPIIPGENNKIGLYKATEASNGPLLFHGVEAKNINPIVKSNVATIEFIGNSITCGFGADTEAIPCGTGTWYDQHNAYFAYGPIVARSLNLAYRLNSVSGMGIYRNWNDEDTSPVMGDVYATAHLDGNKDKKWSFADAQPDVVSICLGTNDFSSGDGQKERKPFNAEKFTANYIDFVERIFGYYPVAKLALLSSPMVAGENNKILLNCLQTIKSHFEQNHIVEIFEFKPMRPNGCGGHPDLIDHEVMATQLIPFYANLLEKQQK